MGRTLSVVAVTIANIVTLFNFNLLLQEALAGRCVGLVERIVVEGPDGPLYGWIKLGLEQYIDPDPISMRGRATTVNATLRGSEPFVLQRTSYLCRKDPMRA